MRNLSLAFLFSLSLPALAASHVSFWQEITPDSMNKLVRNIEKATSKLKPTDERVIVIDLSSGGGNLYAAFKFVNDTPALESRLGIEIDTRVSSTCESACTVLYTAGRKRLARRGASFGFHSPAIASRVPRGVSRSAVLESARARWLAAISRVDAALAYEIDRRNLLMDEEMSYVSGRSLDGGYVTNRE